MDKTEAKYIKLTTKPVGNLLAGLSAPAIAGMLITAIYNAADSYFVSSINDSAVGSIGVIFSFMAVLQAVGFLFGHGSGNFMSRELGKQNYEDSGKIAVTGFVLSFCTGLLLAIFGLIFIKPLALFLGSTQTILPYAIQYLRCILIAAPFQCAALTLNNQLRFQGNAKHGMVGLGFGAILNMGLDPLLIFVFKLGVTGAGIATTVSQIISFFILLIFTYRGGNMPIKLNRFTLTKAYLREIFRGGVPSFGRQVIGSVATILLNTLLKPYGDSAIAAMTVVSKVSQILLSVMIGLGQGFQPVCGMNYGAKKYSRVLKAFWVTVGASTAVMTTGAVINLIFAPQIVSIFSDEASTIQIAARGLRYQSIPAALSAFYMIGSMMLQNLGKSAKATLLAVSRQGVFFLPLLMLMSHFWGLTGILLAQPAADILSFVIGVPFVSKQLKELGNKQTAEEIISGNR